MATVKYIRVSTSEQNTARQESNLKMYTDKCSGIIPFSERTVAKKLLKACQDGKIECINVSSIDRLGRNAFDIQSTINQLSEMGVNIFAEDLAMYSLKDGEVNPMFKLITDLLANVAQMELNNIKERQRQGIEAAKKRGAFSKPRARQSLTDDELLEKNEAIVTCLQNSMSLKQTATATGKSIPTITKVKRTMRILGKL
uniref:recombinase family protein n=1 Tax=uncultured Draconibacterium sp. TaxID=1573823 RepID=UPI003216ED39